MYESQIMSQEITPAIRQKINKCKIDNQKTKLLLLVILCMDKLIKGVIHLEKVGNSVT